MPTPLNVFVNIGAKILPSLGSAVGAAERQFGSMARKGKIAAIEMKVAWKEAAAAMKPIAAMVAAGGLSIGLKGIFGESSKYAHEISMLRVAGRTSKEVASAIAQANRTMRAVPTSTLTDNLKVLNETTLAYGNFGHALENLTFNQRMGGMLQNMLGEKAGDTGTMFNNLIRSMEIRGSALDQVRYQREASKLYQAMIATGGTVNPEAILGFTQQANPAVRGYDERFFTRIVPSLIQEFGGERAGTALTAFNNQILGRVGVGGKKITEEWVRLGLVPKLGTGGNLSKTGWTAGSMRGTALAMSDPLAFAERFLLPAMARAGININDDKAVTLETKKLFGRETGARIASTLLGPAQRKRLHKDERLFGKALGPDAAFNSALKNDPVMAWSATTAAFKNLETVLGKAVSGPVAGGINALSRGIEGLVGIFDRHPTFAKGVVALMGFGLATATLKTFGIAVRWVFSPLRGLMSLLFKAGPRNIGVVGWLFRGLNGLGRVFGGMLGRLGPVILGGLARLAPWILRGVAVFAEVLTGPVGWALLAASVAELLWTFRGSIAKGWTALVTWTKTKALPALANAFRSINWRAVGWFIADALTFGLASRLPGWVKSAVTMFKSSTAGLFSGTTPASIGPVARTAPRNVDWTRPAAPKLAGRRALGGPVRAGEDYLVGEYGPEIARFDRPGAIIPAHQTQRIVAGGGGGIHAPITIYGATDPQAVGRAVRAELATLARRQSFMMND